MPDNRIEIEKQLAEFNSQKIKDMKEIHVLNEKLLANYEREKQLVESALDLQSKRKDLEGEMLKLNPLTHLDKIEKINKKILDNKEKELKIEKEILDLTGQTGTVTASLLPSLEKQVEQREQITKESEKALKAQEKSKEVSGEFQGVLDKVFGSTLGIKENWLSSFIEITKNKIATDGWRGMLGQVAEHLKKFSFTSSLAKVGEMTLAVAMKTDEANAAFNKATGAGKDYRRQIDNIVISNLGFGVSHDKVSEAFTSLYGSFSGFNDLSKGTQESLVTTDAMLANIGVSIADSSEAFLFMSKNMGLSGTGAIDMKNRFTKMAGPGRTVGKVFSDFNKAQERMALFSGPKLERVFSNLSNLSSKLGVDITKVLSAIEKFDTFDQASQSVAQFNAILGGDFMDAISLMQADGADRIMMFKDSLDSAGISFSNLDKFAQKHIAEQVGLDVATAGRLFGMGRDELTKYNSEQKSLEDRGLAAQSVMEDLKDIAMSFALVIAPLITELKALTEGFLKMNKRFQDWSEKTLGYKFSIVHLGTAILGLLTIFKLFKSGSGILAGALGKGLSGAIEALTTKIFGAGTAAKTSVAPMLAFAASVALAGAGVAMMAYGIADLARSFQGLTTEQIVGALSAMGVLVVVMAIVVMGLLAVAGAGTAAALPMLALAASVLMMGAGMAMAGYGLSLVYDSVGNIITAIVKGIGAIGGLIGNISTAFGDFTKNLDSFSDPVKNSIITMNLIAIASALDILTSSLSSFNEIAEKTDFEKFNTLKDTLASFSSFLEITQKVDPERVEQVIDVSIGKTVESINNISKTSKDKPGDDIWTQTLLKEKAQADKYYADKEKGKSEEIHIHLNLDGRELESFIIDKVGKYASIRKNN